MVCVIKVLTLQDTNRFLLTVTSNKILVINRFTASVKLEHGTDRFDLEFLVSPWWAEFIIGRMGQTLQYY